MITWFVGVRDRVYDKVRDSRVREVCDRVRKVRSSASKAHGQKISLPCKQGEIKSYLNILENVKSGKVPALKLEKVIKGLEKLI